MNASNGVALVESPEHFRELILQDPWEGQKYILQEFVPGGREYATYCLFENGKLLWHCSYAFTYQENSIRLTGENMERVVASAAQLDQIQRFIAPLNYTGPCNIDYKLRPDGSIAILEINPRLGGTLMRPENVEDLSQALSLIIEKASLNSTPL